MPRTTLIQIKKQVWEKVNRHHCHTSCVLCGGQTRYITVEFSIVDGHTAKQITALCGLHMLANIKAVIQTDAEPQVKIRFLKPRKDLLIGCQNTEWMPIKPGLVMAKA